MGRRTLLVIASVLVAAAGTALIWMYVQGADSRAKERWKDEVNVLVAKEAIQIGASADDIKSVTEVRQIPAILLPEHPIQTVKAIGRKTTTMPILAGQFLVQGQFDESNTITGVPDGHVALAVNMDDPNRVASLLHPGSHVAVYRVGAGTGGSATMLYADVPVLGIGTTTAALDAEGGAARVGTQSQVSTAVVTLDVTVAQAPHIMSNREALYFVLLGKDAQVTPQNDVQGSGLTSTAANG
jgi:pilus assembly protein CpaB